MSVPSWETSRSIVTKVSETTNPDYGCSPSSRLIHNYLRYGIVNLDKPSGPSSHEVVAWVKRILKNKRAGHTGTLDPMVTGVLPVAFEEATKIVGVLLLVLIGIPLLFGATWAAGLTFAEIGRAHV